MENVLIDPKMFMLQTECAAEKNIDFFCNVISLCNEGQILVCLYQEVVDLLNKREINPFPINISDIKDQKLKSALLQLNGSFVRTVMNNYIFVDIDECKGGQEFTTSRHDLEETSEYYAFFGMLLTPCYLNKNFSDKVLVGETDEGVVQGEQVEITCSCESKHYKKVFSWISPWNYLPEKQKAKELLRKLVSNKKLYIESPEIKKGQHHNHIQKNDFNCYEELAAKNKRVITYLRWLGLYKIIFADFAPDTTYEYGSIKIIDVEETSDSDIVIGWLYACLDFRIKVNLFFPKGIGTELRRYSKGELLQKEVEELITSLGV
jgi:hypothetical protein